MTERLYFWRSLLIGAAALCVTGALYSAGAGGLVVALAAALSAALISALVLMRLSSRIRVVRDTATAIADGKLDLRFRDLAEDDIGQLGSELNRLAERVRRVSEDLGEGNSRLIAVLNSSLDPIIAVGHDGLISLANQAAEQLLGREREVLVGTSVAWVLPDEGLDNALRAALTAGSRSVVAVERHANQHLEATVTPIVGGGEWLVLVVLRDLTDMRRTERMRRDFVANVSHELRTPLAAIKAVVETLEGGGLDDRPRALEFLGRAEDEIDRLSALVEQLLELSRLEAGDLPMRKERVDMGVAIRSVVDRLTPLAEKQGVGLEVLGDEGAGVFIDGDQGLIEQAVRNIVENGIKFTGEGGRVTAKTMVQGGEVVVEISDTGAGISDDDLPRIFQRFYKVDAGRWQPGSGLGLAIAKHAVESHGGHLEVESELGRGTTFRICLPLKPEPVLAEQTGMAS